VKTVETLPTKKRRCDGCGNLYVTRPRREPICLTCDIRDRAARGELVAEIAARFALPRFLIAATLEDSA